VLKSTVSFHLAVAELTRIDMPLRPLELSRAVQLVTGEGALVRTAICEDGTAESGAEATLPLALVLGEDTVGVAVSIEDLEAESMSDHPISFVLGGTSFIVDGLGDQLVRFLGVEVGNLAVVS